MIHGMSKTVLQEGRMIAYLIQLSTVYGKDSSLPGPVVPRRLTDLT